MRPSCVLTFYRKLGKITRRKMQILMRADRRSCIWLRQMCACLERNHQETEETYEWRLDFDPVTPILPRHEHGLITAELPRCVRRWELHGNCFDRLIVAAKQSRTQRRAQQHRWYCCSRWRPTRAAAAICMWNRVVSQTAVAGGRAVTCAPQKTCTNVSCKTYMEQRCLPM